MITPICVAAAVRVSGEGVGEDLQRDVAAELGVGGAIDLAHAGFADESGDVVMAEPGANFQSHRSDGRDLGGRAGRHVDTSLERRVETQVCSRHPLRGPDDLPSMLSKMIDRHVNGL